MESLYLFNTMVVIRFYVDNNVLLSRLEASLHRLLHKLNEFCTSSSLEANLSKTRTIIFGRNKRKSGPMYLT